MRRRSRFYEIALALSALALFGLAVAQPRLLDDLRNLVFDSYQRAAPRPYDPQAPVRVVGVDEQSLAAYGQWPWSRRRLAELTDRLAALGPAAIAFDFMFAEADRASPERLLVELSDADLRRELERLLGATDSSDAQFARATAAAPVVLAATLAETGVGPSQLLAKAGFVTIGDDYAPFLPSLPAIVAPLPALAEAARGIGVTNWIPDRDQVVRRAPLFLEAPQGGVVPSLALEAVRVAQGETTYLIRSSNASGETAFGRRTGVNAVKVGAFEIATSASGEIRPRYAAPSPERTLSAAHVLQGQVDRSEIEGRIVFVGGTAVGLGDIRATPLDPATPGVEVHAQIVECIASGSLLARPDWARGGELLVSLLAFLLVAALMPRIPPLVAAFASLALIATLFGLSFLSFAEKGLLLDPVFPSLAIGLCFTVGASALWWLELVARQYVREAFGKYLAPAVVDRLAENPERLSLGGETRELTVLNCDLRDFSGLSEGMDARELTQFMNDYLTPMTDAILEREGTIDKYMGDAILAFWNAPLDVADHHAKAVEAALAIRSRLAAFNAQRAARAAEQGRSYSPLAMGIGLASGPCCVGNIGSLRRFDYSILGDVVNIASRLDGATKTLPTDVIVEASVCAGAPQFAWLSLGEVIVIGRKTPTPIAALAGDAQFAQTPEFAAWREKHEAMRARYVGRRFDEAAGLARALAEERAVQWRALYAALARRFGELHDAPPGGAWTPVWTLTEK